MVEDSAGEQDSASTRSTGSRRTLPPAKFPVPPLPPSPSSRSKDNRSPLVKYPPNLHENGLTASAQPSVDEESSAYSEATKTPSEVSIPSSQHKAERLPMRQNSHGSARASQPEADPKPNGYGGEGV